MAGRRLFNAGLTRGRVEWWPARLASPRHAGHLPVELPAGLSFHHDADIPKALRGLPGGASRIALTGAQLHVFSGHDA
ncbi:MAG TPA: hypothetical protein VF616_28355, partial [Duganella sp.]